MQRHLRDRTRLAPVIVRADVPSCRSQANRVELRGRPALGSRAFIGTNFRPSVTVGSDGKLIGATPCHPTAASRAFLVSTRPLAKPTIRPLSSASLLERSTLSDPRMVGTGASAEPALITTAGSPQSSALGPTPSGPMYLGRESPATDVAVIRACEA